MPASFTAIWEFQVKPDACSEFERIYGTEGEWAQLFCSSPEYRGTELVRDADRPGRYLTLDHWTSRDALQQFKRDHYSAYAALDKQCECLTEREVFLGDFEQVSS